MPSVNFRCTHTTCRHKTFARSRKRPDAPGNPMFIRVKRQKLAPAPDGSDRHNLVFQLVRSIHAVGKGPRQRVVAHLGSLPDTTSTVPVWVLARERFYRGLPARLAVHGFELTAANIAPVTLRVPRPSSAA